MRLSLSFTTVLFLGAVLFLSGCLPKVERGAGNVILLDNEASSISIGDYIYLTPDPDEKLDAKTIAERHMSNLLGTRNTGKLINLSAHKSPVWLVFIVRNQTSETEWVINFGDLIDGRQALINGIYAVENETGQTLIKLGIEDEKTAGSPQTAASNDAPSNILHHEGLKLSLDPSENRLVIIKLSSSGPFPQTIKPSLLTYRTHMEEMSAVNPASALYKMVMLLAAGFVFALAVIQKKYAFTVFCLYIALQLLVVTVLESHFYTPHGLIKDVIALLFIAAIFTKWLSTQLFFTRTALDNRCLVALVLSSLLIMGSFILNLFWPGMNGNLNEIFFILSITLSSFVALALSIAMITRKKLEGLWLSASWSALIIGLLSQFSLLFDIQSTYLANGIFLWMCLPFQVGFYTKAALCKIENDREEEETRKARDQRAQQSMARLQQAKESSDQARLLRVIERERELMAELREREMLRTEEMRKAKVVADEANRAKSAFLAVVSHEVRTPMNGIMGMIRLLSGTQVTRQQKEYLQTMQTSGETMMALLNDILDFEKIESGKMELEYIPFDMTKLVQDVITLMTGHAAEKNNTLNAKISSSFPRTLKGDPTRLRQILLNLVNNAIKFTENGVVTIHLKAAMDNQNTKPTTALENPNEVKPAPAPAAIRRYNITCAVEDTGIGISKEAQETLFTPFTQASKSTSRKYGGTGLGLTICRRLVEAMRGRIFLESTEGVGSTFTFNISLEAPKDIAREAEKAQSDKENPKAADPVKTEPLQKASPMNILVIEDNEMNRRVIKGFLEKESHTVTLCNSAERALEICASRMFDAIISDINLGGMDGMEFTRNLRIFPNRKIAATPVIALSGNIEQEDKDACFKANMNGFLIKPVNPENLATILLGVQTGALENPLKLPDGQVIHMQGVSSPSSASLQTSKPLPPAKEGNSPEDELDRYIPAPAPLKSKAADASPPSQDQPPAREDSEEEEYVPQPPPPKNTPVPAPKTAAPAPVQSPAATFDPDFLKTLAGSLPADQMRELIDGCMDKADEIITEMEAMNEGTSAEDIYAKAHELKGMAANFGITSVADLAKAAEQAAKAGDIPAALAHIEKLADTNRRAREDITQWLKSF